MHRIALIGGAGIVLLAIACSDSSSAPKQQSDWSGAVIKVAASNPNAKGELRGIVVDSTSGLDPTTATPIAGATVVLNLKVTMQPGSGGSDTAWTTVQKVGEVVTDANGKFPRDGYTRGRLLPPGDATGERTVLRQFDVGLRIIGE